MLYFLFLLVFLIMALVVYIVYQERKHKESLLELFGLGKSPAKVAILGSSVPAALTAIATPLQTLQPEPLKAPTVPQPVP